MEPVQYQWRLRARVIGYIDLVVSGISVLLAIILLLGALGFTAFAVAANDKDNPLPPNLQLTPMDKDNVTLFAIAMWIASGLVILITFIQILAAVRLVNGTEIGRPPVDALRLTRFYRNVTVVFMTISALSLLAWGPLKICTIIDLLIRGIFLFIVMKFMGELEVAILTARGTPMAPPQYKV